MQSPSKAVDLFRSAVSAGAFSEAEGLLETYRRDVEASWRAATSEDQRLAIAMEVSEVFEWARTATLAARSHTQRKLILLRRESAYTPSVRKNEVLNLNA
jgi:C4-type Zn-finger protein